MIRIQDLDKVAGVREAVEILKRYGVRKVILFGSFARGSGGKYSDIDIAYEGLAPEVFFRALGEILSELDRDVDLVDLQEIKDTLRNRIEEEGVLVYEAS